jgi:hypothetical protein
MSVLQPSTDSTTDIKWRKVLFIIGWFAAMLSTGAGFCTWFAHFPLLSDGQGGWRLNPLEDWVLIAGVVTGFSAAILGVFGKRAGRVLLIVFGIFLILFNAAGWLGNHR